MKLYYYAKNRVYAQSTYYDEIKAIDSRRIFGRSLAVTSFLYFVLAVLLALFLLVQDLAVFLSGRQDREYKLKTSVLVVLVVLFVTSYLSHETFKRESKEFNNRTFGYFSSMLISDHRQNEQKMMEIARANQTNITAGWAVRACPNNRC